MALERALFEEFEGDSLQKAFEAAGIVLFIARHGSVVTVDDEAVRAVVGSVLAWRDFFFTGLKYEPEGFNKRVRDLTSNNSFHEEDTQFEIGEVSKESVAKFVVPERLTVYGETDTEEKAKTALSQLKKLKGRSPTSKGEADQFGCQVLVETTTASAEQQLIDKLARIERAMLCRLLIWVQAYDVDVWKKVEEAADKRKLGEKFPLEVEDSLVELVPRVFGLVIICTPGPAFTDKVRLRLLKTALEEENLRERKEYPLLQKLFKLQRFWHVRGPTPARRIIDSFDDLKQMVGLILEKLDIPRPEKQRRLE